MLFQPLQVIAMFGRGGELSVLELLCDILLKYVNSTLVWSGTMQLGLGLQSEETAILPGEREQHPRTNDKCHWAQCAFSLGTFLKAAIPVFDPYEEGSIIAQSANE